MNHLTVVKIKHSQTHTIQTYKLLQQHTMKQTFRKAKQKHIHLTATPPSSLHLCESPHACDEKNNIYTGPSDMGGGGGGGGTNNYAHFISLSL